jgi:RluA family pseudouridine synthase
VAKPAFIEFSDGETIPILYEDRSVMVIDKPRGWMLAPTGWHKTSRNLQAALQASLRGGEFWARSRNLKYLRFIHRLDAGTSGLLLLAKSPGALSTFGALFQGRMMEKVYLAVVHGAPQEKEWVCRLKLGPDAKQIGKMKVDPVHGKAAETRFHALQTRNTLTLVEARPLTGRTHQIRVHLAGSGHAVVGDELYGRPGEKEPLALRAVALAYADPFTKMRVRVRAPVEEFVRAYGFEVPDRDEGPDYSKARVKMS